MDPFIAKIEMRGRPAGYAIVFALFILFFAAACAVMTRYEEAPSWFDWTMSTLFGAAGLSLLGYAIFCAWRGYMSTFEASEESIVWFWTDRAGKTIKRREVAIRDIVEIRRFHGTGDSPGGLYLELHSGESVDVLGYAQPDSGFLDWIAVNHPGIRVRVE